MTKRMTMKDHVDLIRVEFKAELSRLRTEHEQLKDEVVDYVETNTIVERIVDLEHKLEDLEETVRRYLDTNSYVNLIDISKSHSSQLAYLQTRVERLERPWYKRIF